MLPLCQIFSGGVEHFDSLIIPITYIDTALPVDHHAVRKLEFARTVAALAELAATVPLGRTGITADVVEVVVHLASDKSSYSTGAEFTMDGGTGL